MKYASETEILESTWCIFIESIYQVLVNDEESYITLIARNKWLIVISINVHAGSKNKNQKYDELKYNQD